MSVRVANLTKSFGRGAKRQQGNHPEIDALLKRYQVKAFPTLVIADRSGAVIKRIEGYPGRTEVVKAIEEAIGP